MRFVKIMLLCFTLCLAFCSCKGDAEVKQTVFLPDENTKNTVNGYKTEPNTDETEQSDTQTLYIVNTSSGKFHLETCRYAKELKDESKDESRNREKLIADGYSPCKVCKP